MRRRSRVWYVYCVQCRDGSVYTGMTTDPQRRVRQHNRGTGAAYTRMRRPVTLLYQERQTSRQAAMRRERAIKKLPRAKKLDLEQDC